MTTNKDRTDTHGAAKRRFGFSRHALDELAERQIPEALAESVLRSPGQIVDEIEGLKAYQSKVDFGTGRVYLLRIIVNEETQPATIVTAYRTSKVTKYWRKS